MEQDRPLYSWGQPISSWEEVRDEIERRSPSRDQGKPRKDERVPLRHENKEPEDLAEVEGNLRPLVEEGPRVMVCINHELKPTRHGPKDYLYWQDENSGLVLEQFFPHYKKYPLGSKAVRNYIVATGVKPKRLDRISLKQLIGLRAEVYVETVKPTYAVGVLKGKPMPEVLHYSKVAEILRPLGYIDPDTLNQLRNKC